MIVHPNVHSSTIYNSQDTEATQVSINRWMDKDVVYIYIYTYIYTYTHTHIYMYLTTLGTSSKWNHTAFVFLCLASFS